MRQCVLLWVMVAALAGRGACGATSLTFTTLDVPGKAETYLTAIDGGRIFGYTDDVVYAADSTTRQFRGFAMDGNSFTTMTYPTGNYFVITGASGGRFVGGDYGADGMKAFVSDGTIYSPVNYPGSAFTEANAIDGDRIGGDFALAGRNPQGFILQGGQFTVVDPPGSKLTMVLGLDGGKSVGAYYDAQFVSHGFIFDGTTYTTFDPPGAEQSFVQAMDGDRIVGSYTRKDVNGHDVNVPYLWDGHEFMDLDVPGSWPGQTQAMGIEGDAIVGTYAQPAGLIRHGFIAVIPEPGTIGVVGAGAVALVIGRGRRAK
jgi:hypothetical protein